MSSDGNLLRMPALEIRQTATRRLYVFGVDGKALESFAAVSRIHRSHHLRIEGYQRPEVEAHIRSIQRYLESPDPMLPNALVVAFDERVSFEPEGDNETVPAFVRRGHLVIPLVRGPEYERPAWIVDGQQRSAAIRQARLGSFPVCAVGFIAKSEDDQRSQFILVNSTKPLPKGLIHELLPETEAPLPPTLQRKKLPARLVERLNYDQNSPFFGKIRTPTCPEGTVKDNSVLRMLVNSLSDGVLYRYCDAQSGSGDIDGMIRVLSAFWTAVRQIWPTDWDLPPRKSRLLHGVGVIGLGYVMDAISDRDWARPPDEPDVFIPGLRTLEPHCRWSSGYWQFGPHDERKWNDLQNTPGDIRLLTNYLIATLRA